MNPHTEILTRLGACPEAIAWADGYGSAEAAWAACERGDWMLWIAGRLAGEPGSDSRRPLVLAACECARLALSIYEGRRPGDARPRTAIETAERWARGGDGAPTVDEVRTAAYAAYAYAAYAAAAADAAAADAAAYAYADAADADGRKVALAQMADLVRGIIVADQVAAGLEASND